MELVNTMRDLLHLNPLYGEQFRTLLSLSECVAPAGDASCDASCKGLFCWVCVRWGSASPTE